MRLVSSAAQVRELDRRVIEGLGLPGVALMELASRAVALAIRTSHAEAAARGVVVVCGGGNNGGDGYGAARWLRSWGFPVGVVPLSATSPGDAGVLRAVCAAAGVPEVDDGAIEGAGLLVDAVFGTGLDRVITGRHAAILERMRQAPAPVIAVDLPSGLHADTGQVLGVCVPAARTVTFGRLKPGLLCAPGAELAGVVEVADIGLEAAPGAPDLAVAEIPDAADLAAVLPRRGLATHKTRQGHVLVVAGSTWMAGAAALACRAALAVGAGLVSLLVPRGAHPRLGSLPPEVMVRDGGPGDVLDGPSLPTAARFDAFAVGPGLGGGAPLSLATAAWLRELWALAPGGVVFDADALGCAIGAGAGPRVVTPHAGEASRLMGKPVAEIDQDRFGAARALAVGRVALLKGPNTLIAAPGMRLSVNPTGSPVLASGGTGDVLTGLVGGLLARGLSDRDAARVAAWVHGRAGELLAAQRAEGWTASDVVRLAPVALAELAAAGTRS